ncbi:hypothetical protein ES705_21882 [subsurface metagenome]
MSPRTFFAHGAIMAPATAPGKLPMRNPTTAQIPELVTSLPSSRKDLIFSISCVIVYVPASFLRTNHPKVLLLRTEHKE